VASDAYAGSRECIHLSPEQCFRLFRDTSRSDVSAGNPGGSRRDHSVPRPDARADADATTNGDPDTGGDHDGVRGEPDTWNDLHLADIESTKPNADSTMRHADADERLHLARQSDGYVRRNAYGEERQLA
jgi:hypothetical protein